MRTSTLSALAAFTASSVVTASAWWSFCNDNQCKEGCGMTVSDGNDGCLQQNGRLSLWMENGDPGLYFPVLVGYKDANCQEVLGCNALERGDGCTRFETTSQWKWAVGAQSFKLINSNGAVAPSCPNDCYGLCPREDIPGLNVKEIAASEETSSLEMGKRDKEPAGQLKKRGGPISFCDDDDCSDNCSDSTIPTHGGCFEGETKGSIKSEWGEDVVLYQYFDGNKDCTGTLAPTINIKDGCNKVDQRASSYEIAGV